ncbi:MAG: c-type cytochrome [Pseudomonadota bacterium]
MLSKRILCLGALSAGLLGAAPVSAEVVPEATDGFYCTTCHGSEGQGNVAIDAPRIAGMERWYLERQMNLFRDGLRGTHPEDLPGQEMQPMAAILDDEKLEQVLDWVDEWDYVPAEPTLTDGDVRNGRSLYQSCVACHGAEGEGREMMNSPALAGQNDWYLVQQLKNFKAGYRGYDNADTYGSQMRMMAQQLNDEQAMRDVVSYINTLGRD